MLERLNLPRPTWKFFKSFLIPYVFLLSICCVVIDLIFTDFIVLKTEISNAGKLNHLISDNDEEIPIFGSSRARCSYIPEIISPLAYNYGFDGNSLDGTLALLEIEKQKKRTTPIIINFDYMFFGGIGDIKTYIPLSNNENIKNLLETQNLFRVHYYVPGIRYFNTYDYYAKEWFNQKFEATKSVKRGYTYDMNRLFHDSRMFAKDVEKRAKEKHKWKPDKKQSQALLKLIISMKYRHFFILAAPYHKTFYNSISNLDDVDAFTEKLNQLPNVTFADFRNHNYPDSLFSNTSHLNQWGAERYSNEIIQVIKLKR